MRIFLRQFLTSGRRKCSNGKAALLQQCGFLLLDLVPYDLLNHGGAHIASNQDLDLIPFLSSEKRLRDRCLKVNEPVFWVALGYADRKLQVVTIEITDANRVADANAPAIDLLVKYHRSSGLRERGWPLPPVPSDCPRGGGAGAAAPGFSTKSD